VEYRWEPETGLNNSSIPNPIATPNDPIRYYVYGISEYGCEEVDSVFIDVLEDITVYNVFSPNGDGINEYFEIEHADRFPEMLVQVYSRWGDLLFSTVGYHSGSWWDGRARGKEAPVGTYYYVVVPYPGAKPITGHVTIIR
jgi:gliding motility-associated-like protein